MPISYYAYSQSRPARSLGRRTLRWALAVLVGVSAVVLPAVITTGRSNAARPAPAATAGTRPNIVFVLTDDLSSDLVQYMPHVLQLARDGVSFSNYTVTDSLCCPSRSSIFSGNFPHNTHVLTNSGGNGGFQTFHDRGEESSTLATDLQGAGYRTAMMGKYLNGYLPNKPFSDTATYVPPGWDEWDVAGGAYDEFDYLLNENHQVVHYGSSPSDYLTDVLSRRATDFVDTSVAAKKPFFAEIATFAAHKPYTPAPRDADSFPNARQPQGPRFDNLPENAPAWLAPREPLTADDIDEINTDYRQRVQSVQAVDDMIGSLEATLKKDGVADDTDIVFSSDNGLHLGQYRLMPGKMTAYDTDILVPLIAAGPGIPAGVTATQPAENIDLRPTFDQLAGTGAPRSIDGRSLVPLLGGDDVPGWRSTAMIEHHGPDTDTSDPDYQDNPSANPPSYDALRTTTYTYVEYADGETEYYDRSDDPNEMDNIAGSLPQARLDALHRQMLAIRDCQGQSSCWRAAGGGS